MKKRGYLLFCLLLNSFAYADPMVVHASVIGTCTFAQPNDVVLDFGGLMPGQGDRQRSVDVQFACTAGMPFKVTLSEGLNMVGTKRRMALGGKKDFLPYELSTSTQSGVGQGEGKMLSVSLTGKVAGSDYAQVTAGEYSDVVVLTVSP